MIKEGSSVEIYEKGKIGRYRRIHIIGLVYFTGPEKGRDRSSKTHQCHENILCSKHEII
jgi:hypothetical protein